MDLKFKDNAEDVVIAITIKNNSTERKLNYTIVDSIATSSNLSKTISGGNSGEIAVGASKVIRITFKVIDKNKSVGNTSFNYVVRLNDPSYVPQNSYLLTGEKWQAALQAANSNYTNANIKTIEFTNIAPTSSGYTTVSVGATTAAGTTAYVAGTAGVADVTAYVKANSSDNSKYDVIFYSPETIYAPSSSRCLFSNSSTSNYFANLTSLNLNNFNTSKVSDMYSMFEGCSSLTSLDVTKFDTSGIEKHLGYMFKNCSKLTEIDLSSFTFENSVITPDVFLNCNELEKITAPSKMNSAQKFTLPSNGIWTKQGSEEKYKTITLTEAGMIFILILKK